MDRIATRSLSAAVIAALCITGSGCVHSSQPQASSSPTPAAPQTQASVAETESPASQPSPNGSSAPSPLTGSDTPNSAGSSPAAQTSDGNAAGGAVVGQIGQVLQAMATPTPTGGSAARAPTPQPDWTPTGAGTKVSVPLRVGLTVVTAGESPDGDLESIKQISALGASGMTFSFDSKLQFGTIDAVRTTTNGDLESARKFFPDFCNGSPPKFYANDEVPVQGEHPGTTTLEISKASFGDLASQGTTAMTFYPSTFCMAMANATPAQVTKIGEGGVPIILNNQPMAVAAVHLHGGARDCLQIPAPIRFGCYDLWVLDDPDNPLVLRFVIEDESMQVIKISQSGPEIENTLAAALAAKKPADVYGIYFDFNQATIRPQSESTLRTIAQLLEQNPRWRLEIDGHTDSIGSAAYNLALSRRRAEAVKAALVSRYHIDPRRLATNGFGASRPKATNATIEGRALNRRVELTRLE